MARIGQRYYQNWSDLTPRQQERSGSQREHAARRDELGLRGVNVEKDTKARMAGDAIIQMNANGNAPQSTIDAAEKVIYGGGIGNFDAAAAGKGAKHNKAKLSGDDIRGLQKYGATEQEILDYVAANPEVNTSGAQTQAYLNRFRANLMNKDDGGDEGGGEAEEVPVLNEVGGLNIDPYIKQNRESTDFWNSQAAEIGDANWAKYGRDNDAEYEKDMLEVSAAVLAARGNATANQALVFGDVKRYEPTKFVMNWGQDPVDTDLENDEIDFD